MKIARWQVIETMIRRGNWRIGAELGVLNGATFFHLLKTFPHLKMIGVDHWDATPGLRHDKESGITHYDHVPMAEFAANVKRRAKEYGPRAQILHMTTKEAADKIEDASLDFIFIDASHDTGSVLEDIANWRPKVRKGGGLIGHDSNWPSVQRALAAAFHPADVTYLDANIWFVRA